jgi:hypothetical protein
MTRLRGAFLPGLNTWRGDRLRVGRFGRAAVDHRLLDPNHLAQLAKRIEAEYGRKLSEGSERCSSI